MALDPCFLDMTGSTVKLEPLSTVASRYGAPTFAAASTYPARVEPGARVIVNDQGVEQVATATVFVLSTTATAGPQDRLTLPDTRTPEILRVDVLNDEEGQHHLEILVR